MQNALKGKEMEKIIVNLDEYAANPSLLKHKEYKQALDETRDARKSSFTDSKKATQQKSKHKSKHERTRKITEGRGWRKLQ